MSANPYLSGNEDDDLFDSSVNQNSNTYGGSNDNLPPELLDALSRYVNGGNASINHSTQISLACYAAADLISFFGETFSSRNDIPVLSALCDVVNRISEGMLSQFLNLHQARHDIIFCHTVKIYAETISDAVDKAPSEMEGEKLKMFLNVYLSYVNWRLNIAVNEYKEMCNFLEVTVDSALLDNGTISPDDTFTRILYESSTIMSDIKEMDKNRIQVTEYGDDYYNE